MGQPTGQAHRLLPSSQRKALARAPGGECRDGQILDSDPSQSFLRLQPCHMTRLGGGLHTALPGLVAEIRVRHQPYLALGLAWQRRCRHLQTRLKLMATERANGMQEPSEIINALPSGPTGQLI
jgi:hypothetical protein